MPWIYFPKSDVSYYGYKADGFVTGILFLMVLIISLIHIKKVVFPKISILLTTAIGVLLAFLSVYKLVKFEESTLNFNFENPLMGAAFAGMEAGIGVYIMGLAALGIFFFGMWILYSQKASKSNLISPEDSHNNRTLKFIILSLFIVLVPLVLYFNLGNLTQKADIESLRPVLSAETEKMGSALFNGDYSEFVDYNHLIMVQSLGGKDKMIEMLQTSMEGLKETGTLLKGISLSDIYDIKQEGRTVQVVVTQKLIYETNGIENTETQKMLAVSEDNMISWKFINITGKTYAEIKKFFPSLIKDIQF